MYIVVSTALVFANNFNVVAIELETMKLLLSL